ncbi:MAG: hypothetical protein ACE5GW_03815 [Planctomycetota bacterium]
MPAILLLATLLSAPEAEAPPSPRETFLQALRIVQGARQSEMVERLEEFIARSLDGPATLGESVERGRLRRRNLLLGLGILFDHSDTLPRSPFTRGIFAGIIQPQEHSARERFLGRIHVAGRNDAGKHFFLSAALTAAFGPYIAERIGRDKEIADARRFDSPRPSGDGFSFVDLAYNHAGIRYACRLLGWRERARLEEVPHPPRAFLPSIGALELPERIGWGEYRRRFHGSRISEYHHIIESIHAAIDESLARHEAQRRDGNR